MERGSPSPERRDPERAAGPETPRGPQAPAPGPHAPPPGPHAPPPPPQGAPGYGGPVPPGGWQQPIARQESSWVGKPLASWGSRFGAWLIDFVVVLVPVVVLAVVIFGGAAEGDSVWGWVGASILYVLLFASVFMLYAPLLMIREGARNGQTLGKQWVGIRVVRDNGQPFGFGVAAFREVVLKQLAVNLASSIIPFIPWFLNYFWPLWDDENRALHDMAASTHVIRA
jgi:uncharacterized RDD family membrane protein YckC